MSAGNMVHRREAGRTAGPPSTPASSQPRQLRSASSGLLMSCAGPWRPTAHQPIDGGMSDNEAERRSRRPYVEIGQINNPIRPNPVTQPAFLPYAPVTAGSERGCWLVATVPRQPCGPSAFLYCSRQSSNRRVGGKSCGYVAKSSPAGRSVTAGTEWAKSVGFCWRAR